MSLPAFLRQRKEEVYLVLLFFTLLLFKLIVIVPITCGVSFSDGYQYWVMGYQIFQGNLDIAAYNHYPPLYPLSLLPVYFFDLTNSIHNIAILNAFYSSLAVFPIYYLARNFLDARLSLLVVLVEGLNMFHILYPANLRSESLYYPLFFAAVYFCFSQAPARRLTLLWDALAGMSIGLLWLTRYMTLPMIPAFLLIWWLKPDFGKEKMNLLPTFSRMKRLLLVGGLACGLYAIWIVMGLAEGVQFKNLLGFQIASNSDPLQLTSRRLLLWGGVTAAYYLLMAAPMLNVLLLSISDLRRGEWLGTKARWLLSLVLLAGAFWVMVTRHAWKAAYNYPDPIRLQGRYLLYFGALFVLTAAIFLANQRRTSFWKILTSGALAACLVMVAYQAFFSTWILPAPMDFIPRNLDGYKAQTLQGAFLLLTGASLLASSLLLWKNKLAEVFLVWLCFSAAVNLTLASNLHYRIENEQARGRFLDEVVDKILIDPDIIPLADSGGKVIIQVFNSQNSLSTVTTNLRYEFTARGYSIKKLAVKSLPADLDESFTQCPTRWVILPANGSEYRILHRSPDCVIPPENLVSTFRYASMDYALVKTRDASGKTVPSTAQ